MPIPVVLSYAAVYFSLITAAVVLLRDRKSPVHRAFAAGMFLLAAEQVVHALSYGTVLPSDRIYWEQGATLVSGILPAIWLAFSISYARVNARSFLSRWKWILLATAVAPIAFISVFRESLYSGVLYLAESKQWAVLLGWPGRALQFFSLLTSILIVFNLERTIRSSTGRMRWQIKFLALGVGGLFALRIYFASQALLFYRIDEGFAAINAVALIAANILLTLSLTRGHSLNVDVYLSKAAIENSLTIILAGIYLLSVGVMAHLTRYLSPRLPLPFDAFVIFLSLTALAVLLLSNRLRRWLRFFISEHFHRPVYDYRRVWMDLARRTTSLIDAKELSTAVCRMVSESIEVLSVSVWLVDESQRRLSLAGSTAFSGARASEIEKAGKSASELIYFLQQKPGCVDFEETEFAWPKEIMAEGPEFFPEYKLRYAVGLRAGRELVGVMTLNDDRVGKDKTLSSEDVVFLETLAAQLAASLLNLKLSDHLRHAKEVETFQTVSTFFVHDLKNLASRLSLTMQNLPANFDNEEFRRDALRVMSTSVAKIDDMCARLALLRQNIELKLEHTDLNTLVGKTLDEFKGNLKAELKKDLKPVPKALMDTEQMHKVLTNLVMNANEAVNGAGVIQVATIHEGNTVGFAVRDNGCGMSEQFIEKSLFRPFQTTKKRGLGIGLFHSKLIVEAHHGTVEVNSTLGQGTEFRVVLPLA
jgi:putative PEP-CTERM system histidine kinase